MDQSFVPLRGNHDELLDVAARIGRRLARQALWDGSQASWDVQAPDRASGQRRSVKQAAGGTLYQGTAGIAWFLAELARATDDGELRRTAAGALAHALEAGTELLPPANCGFHSGRVGIAWVAARLARLLERPELDEAAWGLLEPSVGHESHDRGLDVIAGAAGAVPALLELAALLERGEPFEMARRLGDHLIAKARRAPDGWSWDTIGNAAVRYLNGLAHGASGVGLALLELARATGDGRYRFAAEMAFLHERRSFDEATANWPDWRNSVIGDYVYYGRLDELRERLKAGDAPTYELHFMAAWCHGSPGIGLARLRAFEITGQTLYRDEAEAALRSTAGSVADEALDKTNYSLCHGIGGNCETLIYAAEILGEPALLEPCLVAARRGREIYEDARRPWPCGTVNDELDPSLMLGEAGIGAFYLRLARPETPSVLILRPAHPDGGELTVVGSPGGFTELARETVDESFATTVRAWRRLAPPGPELPPALPGDEPLARSPVETAFATLRAFADDMGAEDRDEARRALLDDAFELERAVHELTLEDTDFTRDFLRGLVRPAWEEIDPDTARLTLPPGRRLVATDHDWFTWLKTSEDVEPAEGTVFFFLHPRDQRFVSQRVGLLAALVLDALEAPATFADLLVRIAEVIDEAEPRELDAKVRPQLEELYRVGFVDLCDDMPP